MNILDAVDVDHPPVIIHTHGMWLDIPRSALEILSNKRINTAGSIHSAEHAVLSLMPKFVITMPGDVRTECKGMGYLTPISNAFVIPSRTRPARLTFYDSIGASSQGNSSTGAGISRKAFEYIDLLIKQGLERVESCPCDEGCPECI